MKRNRDGGVYNLYKKPAGGTEEEELLLKTSEHKFPTSCSHDGRFLLYTAMDPSTKADLWVLPLEGDRKPIPFLRTEFGEMDGRFSPDMRWIAYVSDESGRNEIYVRGFSQASRRASSEAGGKWLISKDGGTGPRWRQDGKELYYRAPDGNVMAVEVAADTEFQAATPKVLFHASPDFSEVTSILPGLSTWDVTPDGKRFLIATTPVENSLSPFTVVLNWTSLLKK